MNHINKIFIIITLLLIQFLFSDLLAQENTIALKNIQKEIDKILSDTLLTSTTTSIKVINLTTNKTLYDYNSNKLLRPASVLKIFTSAAALDLLPKDFTFKTEVYVETAYDSIINGTLLGNLYVKGFGDPLFTTNDLDTIVKLLTSKNIDKISGNLFGDISYFDETHWGKGWMWDDEPESFAAYISPLSINNNSIKIIIGPGKKEKDSVIVKTEPNTSLINIFNYSITSPKIINSKSKNKKQTLSVTRNWKERDNNIIIEGEIPINSDPKEFSINIYKPEIFYLNLLKERLETCGIIIQGNTIIDHKSEGEIIFRQTRHIDSVISEINKNSNNLASENLLKTLSAELMGIPGNAKNGIQLLKYFLFKAGIDTAKILIVDGSGLSRYNLISANSVIQLLAHIYKNKDTYNRFRSTLPVSGIEGTLKNRFINGKAKNKIFAKTGTHSDVSALAGYIETVNKEMLGFCIIINNYLGETRDYRKIIDRIAEILTNY